MGDEEETFEFHGRVVTFTHAAWLVSDGAREVWIPRSQIISSADELDAGVETEIEVPAWFAEKAGLA